MDCNMPGFPVLHYLLEFAQNHVHWVSDTILPSHPLPPPSFLFAFKLPQYQGFFPVSQLFESGGQSIGSSASESVLSMNIQGLFPLGLMDFISLLSEGLSNTTVQKHQFFSVQSSLWSNSHSYMTTGKTIALTIHSFVGKVMSLFFNTLLGLLIHRNKIDYSIFTFINLVRFIYFL